MQRKDNISDDKGSFFVFPFKIAAKYPIPKLNKDEPNNEQTNIQVATEFDKKFPQVVISVSKKNFKRAVDRNRIKRQIREIYRLAKSNLFRDLQSHQIPVALAIVFVAKEKQDYAIMAKKFDKVMQQVIAK